MIKIIPLIFLVSLLTVTSQIFLKKGLIKTGGIQINNFPEFFGSFIKLLQEKYFIFGAVIAIFAALFWVSVISKKDLTAVFPIASGIFYVLLFLLSWLFLGESITILKIIGTIIIFAGIFLILK
ncbi:MAG: hypothetical protein PHF44_01865 [Candidatus Pacebacteria bacterium]|nr:hypothetical protein [Candidatus Paceibacterota bacterium]